MEFRALFMTMQGVTPLLLPRTSCAAGNGRFWNIHRIHPIWVRAIMLSSPEWKNHCEGTGITQEVNLSVLWGGQCGTSTKMARWWCTTPSNIWQKVVTMGQLYWTYTNVVTLWMKYVRNIDSCHYFLSNPCRSGLKFLQANYESLPVINTRIFCFLVSIMDMIFRDVFTM